MMIMTMTITMTRTMTILMVRYCSKRLNAGKVAHEVKHLWAICSKGTFTQYSLYVRSSGVTPANQTKARARTKSS